MNLEGFRKIEMNLEGLRRIQKDCYEFKIQEIEMISKKIEKEALEED